MDKDKFKIDLNDDGSYVDMNTSESISLFQRIILKEVNKFEEETGCKIEGICVFSQDYGTGRIKVTISAKEIEKQKE
jgi:hypothetical protein